MKTILHLVCSLVFLTVAVNQSCARLGESEDEIRAEHQSATKVEKSPFYPGDKRVFIITFTEKDGWFSAIIFDNACAGEMYARADGELPEKRAVLDEMRKYSEVWEGYDTGNPYCLASRSADRKLQAILGSPKPGMRNSFIIFTEKLREYHLLKAGKDLNKV